jgi:hypothetical protein
MQSFNFINAVAGPGRRVGTVTRNHGRRQPADDLFQFGQAQALADQIDDIGVPDCVSVDFLRIR